MGVRHFRLALAFLTPPIPAMIVGLALFDLFASSDLWEGLQAALVFGTIAAVVVGYPAMLLFGFAAHTLLVRSKATQLWQYALVGALGGYATVFALSLLDGRFYSELLLLAALVGVTNAALFWAIRRPDRDRPA